MPAVLPLPQHPGLWRGDQLPDRSIPSVPTGWHALDVELPGGGWPGGSVAELCVAQPGQGELTLLWPAARQLTEAGKQVLLIAPPAIPYAPAWQQAGVKLAHVHWVRPPDAEDAWWVLEQALRDRACALVLAWLPESPADRVHRRLRLAAETGGGTGLLLNAVPPDRGSPAALRLAVTPRADGLEVRILKRRGPPLLQPLRLPLAGDLDGHILAGPVSAQPAVGSVSARPWVA